MTFRYVLAWLPMLLIAIANAALREAWYGKHLSELRAHQLSTATAILLLGVYIRTVVQMWRLKTSSQAWTAGLIWLGLTVAFEFLFGRYVAGHSWGRLLHDYNLLAGRVWVVLLVWIATAPYVFHRLQK